MDVQKNRKRRSAFFLFFISSLCWVIAAGLQACKNRQIPRPETAPAGAAVPRTDTGIAAQKPACAGPFRHIVKSGETFADIFRGYSISPALGDRFYCALRRAGLSTLFPGDSIVLTRDDACSLSTVSCLNRLTYWYRARRGDSTVIAERAPLDISVTRWLVNGVLETSLLDAMEDAGLGAWPACMLSDIFAWDINFFLDPRRGDSFQILLTKKHAVGRSIGFGDILAARYTCGGRDFYAIGFRDKDGRLQYYDRDGKSVQKEFLKAPLRFSRISSGFSSHRRHPVLGIVRPHFGIDYAAPSGTPVYAAADGKVLTAKWNDQYGNNVEIGHGGSFTTLYGHLASFAPAIHAGVFVKQGQLIGFVGATGLATGAHLDYRMKKNGAPVNPLRVILPSKSGISPAETAAFTAERDSSLSLFSSRFPGKNGCWVLDTVDQQPRQVKSSGDSTSGAKPHS